MNKKPKMNLYYQTDISRSDGGYYNAEVILFESEDISAAWHPTPILTFSAQSHIAEEKDRADSGRAFIPMGIRHNEMKSADCVPWYALRASCTSERVWSAAENLTRAANLAKRINAKIEKRRQADYKAGESSNNDDALLPIIRALVELRAVPVRYGEKGKYEIVA